MIPTKASSIFGLLDNTPLFTLPPLWGIIQRLDQIPHSSLWHLYEELSRYLIRFLILHSGTSTRNYPETWSGSPLFTLAPLRGITETWSGSSLFILAPLRGIIQRFGQVPHSSLWHLYEELSRDLIRFLILHSGTSTRNYPETWAGSSFFTLVPCIIGIILLGLHLNMVPSPIFSRSSTYKSYHSNTLTFNIGSFNSY